jgi:hypothetical protein
VAQDSSDFGGPRPSPHTRSGRRNPYAAYRREDWNRPRPFDALARRMRRLEERITRRTTTWEQASLPQVLAWFFAPALIVLLLSLLIPHS